MTTADDARTVERQTLIQLCWEALTNAGASSRLAVVLTDAALFAEDHGFASVGVSHLCDYLSAMQDGRLDGEAVPEISRPATAVLLSDARRGVFHTGFETVFRELVDGAKTNGAMVLVQRNAYAGGQLGWFTDRVAQEGLLALGAITSSPLLSPGPGVGRVFGTNPMAYSVPRGTEPPITVDQSSSATAYAAVREAATRNDSLPDGWALDAALEPTTDAEAALAGAMLPFGGYKGGNIAWFVELFSSMAGGLWSVDAPSAYEGADCPSVGMFLLALDPAVVDPGYAARVQEHVERLAGLGVRRPGMARVQDGDVPISVRHDVLETLRRAG